MLWLGIVIGILFSSIFWGILAWQLVKIWKREYLESQRLRPFEIEVEAYRDEFGRMADDYSQLKQAVDRADESEVS
jgi:hypothetical protein